MQWRSAMLRQFPGKPSLPNEGYRFIAPLPSVAALFSPGSTTAGKILSKKQANVHVNEFTGLLGKLSMTTGWNHVHSKF